MTGSPPIPRRRRSLRGKQPSDRERHHVTGITADVQANVDFYVGFLGLKLVKRTGGYADAEQLHLLNGDGLGSPGSLLTFLVWEAAAVAAPALARCRKWHLPYRRIPSVTG
jgi:catechol 2,3-dioxygenase-like lactoylglutathione lyase family enzyme